MAKAVHSALLAMMLLASTAGAVFSQEKQDDDTFEEKLIKKFLGGLGVDVGQGSGIEYRERAPLVIPPGRDLPPPQSELVTDPNWPKDPDAQPKKRIKPETLDSVTKFNREKATLSPDQLRRGEGVVPVTPSPTDPNREPVDNTSEYGARPSTPSQLGVPSVFGLFGRKKEEQTQFVREPDRTSLTQPPPGYQTPSPNYPYGLSGDQAIPSSSEMPQAKDPRAGSVRP
jgi:hypothetical protein